MTRPWRVAESLETLRDECNSRWPDRDKASDGTIGDAAHAARVSDHNPWVIDSHGVGVVRALDVDAGPGLNPTGPDAVIGRTVADAAQAAGKAGHAAMGPGAYVIYDHHIASAASNPEWSWRPYVGTDPHTSHPHISVALEPRGYDSPEPWGVFPVKVSKPKRPVLWKSMPKRRAKRFRPQVRHAQRLLNAAFPNRKPLEVDGVFGPHTKARVAQFRRRENIARRPIDGVIGPVVWRALTK